MMVYLKRWIVCSSNIPLLPHLAHPPHYLDQRLLVVDGVGLAHVALRLARVPAVQLVPGLQWRRCSAAVLQCPTCSISSAREFCSSSNSIGCPLGSFAPRRDDFISFNPDIALKFTYNHTLHTIEFYDMKCAEIQAEQLVNHPAKFESPNISYHKTQ